MAAELLRALWRQGLPLLRRDVLTASIGINILSLGLPVIVLQVYDRIIPNAAMETLVLLIGGFAIVLLLDLALKTARAHIAGWAGAHFEHQVAVNSVSTLLSADLDSIEAEAPGRHLDRLGGVDMVRDFYSSQASLALVDLPFVLIFLALLAWIAGPLVLVPAVLLVIFSLAALRLGARLRTAIKDRDVWDDRRYNFIIEALSGLHTIKSLAMEQLIERRYERLMQSCSTAGMRIAYLSGLAQSLGSSFSQITMVLVVSSGAFLVIGDTLSIGGLAACTLLAGRTVQPVLRSLGIWTRFQSIQVAEEKLAELDRYPAAVIRDSQGSDRLNSVELDNVSFSYESDGAEILRGISLKIKRGEIVGIRGGNGSGKTTLLRLMMGSIRPTKGKICLNGTPLDEASANLTNAIAYLPQTPVLFAGSVLDNITMFRPDEMLDDALRMAARLGLDRVFARYPRGFETEIGASASSILPGGVGQRIAIARALLNKPRLILFDEANNALDGRGDAMLVDILQRLRKSTAIVMVTYRPSLLKISDRRYDLEDGQLVDINYSQVSLPLPARSA